VCCGPQSSGFHWRNTSKQIWCTVRNQTKIIYPTQQHKLLSKVPAPRYLAHMNDSVSLGRHSVMGCDISHLFIFGITPLDSFLFWFCTRAVFRSLVYLGSKSHDLNIYYKDLVLQMTSVSLPNDPPLTSNFSLFDIAYLLRGYFRLFRSDQSCHLCILKSLTIQIITHRTIITILATEITDVLLSEMDNPTARTPCVPNRLIWNPVPPFGKV